MNSYYTNRARALILVYVNSVFYGLYVVIAAITLFFITRRLKGTPNFKGGLSFMGLLSGLATINFIAFTHHIVSSVNVVTDPDKDRFSVWVRRESTIPALLVAELIALVITVLCRGFMVYRCLAVWNRSKVILVVSGILIAAVLALGLTSIFIVKLFSPDMSLTMAVAMYAPTQLGVSLILLGLILGRILSKKYSKALGPNRVHNVIMTEVQSSLLYIIGAVVLIVISAIYADSSVEGLDDRIFFGLLTQIECIASALVVFQVARGRAAVQDWFPTATKKDTTDVAKETNESIELDTKESTQLA